MAETVRVGAKPETTRGVSSNPEIAKELLDMVKAGREKKKTVEVESENDLRKLAAELNEQKKTNSDQERRILQLEEQIQRLLSGDIVARPNVETVTDKGHEGLPIPSDPTGHAEAWKDWQDINNEDDPDTVVPTRGPTPPTPPEPGVPLPGDPAVETDPADNRANEAGRELALKTEALNDAIKNFAIARVSREKMFSGGSEQSMLERNQAELNDSFAEWSQGFAKWMVESNRELFDYRTQAQETHSEASQKLVALKAERGFYLSGVTAERVAEIDEQIKIQEDLIAELDAYLITVNEKISETQSEFDRIKAEKLISIRSLVDAEMLAEREKNHPKLTKLTGWLKKHPKTRIAAGVALTGLGFVGAATGNAPLVGVAIAGRTALRGFGAYNAARGAGEMIGDRRMNKTDIDSIEDYTDAATRQSKTRRRSKRVGTAVGVGLAGAPLVGGLLHGPEVVTEPTPTPAPKPPDWLTSREFAEMVHHPETFKQFMSWTDTMKAQGFTEAQIGEMLSKLPPAPEGFGS